MFTESDQTEEVSLLSPSLQAALASKGEMTSGTGLGKDSGLVPEPEL